MQKGKARENVKISTAERKKEHERGSSSPLRREKKKGAYFLSLSHDSCLLISRGKLAMLSKGPPPLLAERV